MIRALILDLDDTIFPTASIDSIIVKPFFDSLEEHNDVLGPEAMAGAKADLWRKPFYVVASEYGFSGKMIQRSLEVLNKLDFELNIRPYVDYHELKGLKQDKFLVTTGFTKLQKAKIEGLGIGRDFKEILIDDPSILPGGKVRVFQLIMEKYGYLPEELLVIGDNPDSEIQAAKILGIPAILIDRKGGILSDREVIISFNELASKLPELVQ